jgi:hypothetical protein
VPRVENTISCIVHDDASMYLESTRPNAAAVEEGAVAIVGCNTHQLVEALSAAAAPMFRHTLLHAVLSKEHSAL